ncbi:MAG: DUF368 domain-containing protein [Clostridiales Family XIII bacterium]|jgi:putative membrane protein|nr:DUF368 domain-containing protein [Clostridiales Family XIII bacterium]
MKSQSAAGTLIGRIAKGFAMGVSMLVPGVSGGTMAVVLGAYDEIIAALGSFRRDVGANCVLLLPYLAGGAAGAALLSGPMLAVLEAWTKPVLFFFVGAIAAGIPPMYRKVRVSRLKPLNAAAGAAGAIAAVATGYLPAGLFTPESGPGPVAALLLLLAGLITAVALILPGISGSYVLLMLGMYDMTLAAFSEADFAYLLPLAAGVLLGVFSTASFLERQMRRRPQFTYMLIIGFVAGSAIQVFPGIPSGAEAPACLAALLCGFGLVYLAGRLGSGR